MEALARRDVIFALGPAGTGKTYVAVAQAVSQLITGSVERLILSRPAVEAGERLGFLPGDMKEKVDPYLRPLYDALYDMHAAEQVERRIASGRDRDRAARLHARAHAGQCLRHPRRGAEHHPGADEDVPHPLRREQPHGDLRRPQSGRLLPMAGGSGLADAVERLEGVEGISVIRFSAADVVRHPIVGRIVQAYEGPDA
jgi:phosphate starvation-inducible PhoH-like protein